MIFKCRWGKKNTNDGGEKKVKKKIYKPKKTKKEKGMLTWKLSRKRRQRCIGLGHSGLNGLKLRQVVSPTPWAGGARLGGRGVVIIVDGWCWWWSWCVVGCCKKGNNNMQGIHFYVFCLLRHSNNAQYRQ